MIGIEVSFLGSGSSGNCAVVRANGTSVLVDAGLSAKETERRLAVSGTSLDAISAIFLTHEHADHIQSALDLNRRRGIPVFASRGTAVAGGFPGPLFADVRPVAGGTEMNLGALHVNVTSTPHDGAESVCFVFADAGGRRVGIATDLGHLSAPVLEALADCEVLGLEANHDEDLLRSGPYPPYLKRRILSAVGHLSNESAAEGLRRLVGPRTAAVVALHVSRHNNTSALAARVFREALDETGTHASLAVARPDEPTGWISS